MPTILAIESTCDETGAAVVADGYNVLSNIVASQIDLHQKYRGVVPEIASRAHIENILPVIQQSLAACGVADRQPFPQRRTHFSESATFSLASAFSSIDAIAVAHRPGLIGSLLIGVTAAKTLAWSLRKPLIAIDHVHAHLYSIKLETNEQPPMPAIGLVCSGGHTAMYHLKSWTDITLIGSTIDDAVGEAYDKVAAILGLGYPGGPLIDNLAQYGDPNAIRFPRSMLGRDSLDFSFSGLKTAVLYHVRGVPGRNDTPPALTDQHIKDIAASFQSACIDTLTKKLRRAAQQFNAHSILIGGGVSANHGLRTAMQHFPLPTFFPKLTYCTDNAAMSAGLAHIFLQQNRLADLDLDAITYSQFIENPSDAGV